MPDRTHLDWPFLDDDHRRFAAGLREWVERSVDASHGDDLDAATRALVASFGAAGWLRVLVPRAYGGDRPAVDVRSICLGREIIAYRSGFADSAFALQGLGSLPITLFGSDEQRAAYLPAIARGEHVAAFALSEADAGSDVAALRTVARADAGDWIISGEKTWISNAGAADHYVVFARTGEFGARGLSAFIVDAGTAGLDVTERIAVIAPHPLGTLRFADCRVPGTRLLGQAGKGFAIAMATLDMFRATVGAAALGFARRALDEAASRAVSRVTFGKPIAEYQLVQGKIAQMAVDVDASALLVLRAAWLKDTGQERVTREAAMAKLFATEAAQRVVDQAVQLFGGLGVTRGQTVERLYREVRALRIYEGTSEIQQLIIAGQVLDAARSRAPGA